MSVTTPNVKGKFGRGVRSSLATLFQRRWLIAYFVQRELSKSYRGSFLGIFWIFLGPVLMIALYTLVFSEILGLRFRQVEGVTNFGLYLYCGLIPFLAFGETVNKAVGTIKSNSTLVQQVVFPLEILPLSTAVTAVLNQVFQFGALAVLILVLNTSLNWTMLLIPFLMIPQLLFYLGLGYLGSVVGTYLPDVQETLRAVVRAMFFLTPILWPISAVADRKYLSLVVDLNPLAYLVGAYRALVFEGRLPDMLPTLYFTVFAAALCFAGILLFDRTKKHFADLV
ncbi:MAG: ABC transporter permease [Rubrobacteraceae bacterium]